jgi:hypothetical protein
VAGSIVLEWSDDALADLDRFAAFLHDQSPELAAIVAQEIITRAQVLSRHPKLGRPLSTREEYRQIVLEVLGACTSSSIATTAIGSSCCESSTGVSRDDAGISN